MLPEKGDRVIISYTLFGIQKKQDGSHAKRREDVVEEPAIVEVNHGASFLVRPLNNPDRLILIATTNVRLDHEWYRAEKIKKII